MADAADLVSQHLISLVGDARRTGLKLEDITIELAAHAACAALAYWSPNDLHALIDVAHEDDRVDFESSLKQEGCVIIPFPSKLPRMG
jgi:hypothetical protein